jgi:hypothetical protein
VQITFDTATAKPAELSALSRFIQDLAALGTAPPVVAEAVKPAPTPPGRGVVIPPPGAAPEATAHTHAPLVIPTLIAPPDRPDAGSPPADDLTAAAVFGGQSISAAPPSAPSVPVVPTAPAAPASVAGPASVTAPPAIAGGPPAGVELDSQGLPWDARIHGSTRARNADGTWRQRRGLNDPDLKKRVEAELRATLALPAAPMPPVAPVAKPWETEQYLAGTVATPAAPAMPKPPAATLPAPATFGEFMGAVSNLVKDGQVTSEFVTRKLQDLGLPSVMALANRPDLLPTVWQALQS